MNLRFAFVTASLLLAAVAPAQDTAPKPGGTYRLQFTLQQTDESRNSEKKTYSLLLEERGWGRLRVGNKVPVQAGPQFTYVDVGLNLNCRLVDGGDRLMLHMEAEASSISPDRGGSPGQPMIRQMKAESETAISPGRATPVAVLDDLQTGRRYEIEVTATKVR